MPQEYDRPHIILKRIIDSAAASKDISPIAGDIWGYTIANQAAAVCFINFYNALAANVTPGTTVPIWQVRLNGNGILGESWSTPIPFSTAISVGASTVLDGTGDPATLPLICVMYQ